MTARAARVTLEQVYERIQSTVPYVRYCELTTDGYRPEGGHVWIIHPTLVIHFMSGFTYSWMFGTNLAENIQTMTPEEVQALISRVVAFVARNMKPRHNSE